jgi:FAD/FMN-containing dehydrogenase
MRKSLLLIFLSLQCLLCAIPPELRDLPYGIYPTSPQYNIVRFNYNRRFNVHPQAIFAPRDYSEITYVFNVLKKYRLDFAMRSGGHCFEPGSLSPCYMIDLNKFDEIIPDVSKSEVFIGAGCRLERVIQTLGELGYAIPTGTCPTVAATGLTLGGGIGLLCRPFGLTCDSVKSILLLNAEGEIITVSANCYADLFWALLGGGSGSYGIVLGFTFAMHSIPRDTFYELIWEWDTKKIAPIMRAWQEWVETLPSNITSVLGIRHPNTLCAMPGETPPLVIRILGLKVGPEPFTEWKEAFEDLCPKVNIFEGSYLETSKYWVSEPLLPYNKNKSRILMKPVSEKVIRQVTRFFESIEGVNYLVYFNFERLGGKVAHYHTSFFPRKAFGWWQQAYYWDNKEQSLEILKLANRFYAKIPDEVSKFCFANIVDYDIGKNYMELYYGTNAPRLVEIKRKYDPKNIFHWKQSIPLRLNPFCCPFPWNFCDEPPGLKSAACKKRA